MLPSRAVIALFVLVVIGGVTGGLVVDGSDCRRGIRVRHRGAGQVHTAAQRYGSGLSLIGPAPVSYWEGKKREKECDQSVRFIL